ncbi:MAG: hypothetical protein Q8Q09_02775 [Deltaproteobacteria bacterium]|nr:hypothetical protein [Deltaproteobacteria bacterium]
MRRSRVRQRARVSAARRALGRLPAAATAERDAAREHLGALEAELAAMHWHPEVGESVRELATGLCGVVCDVRQTGDDLALVIVAIQVGNSRAADAWRVVERLTAELEPDETEP